VVEHFRPLYVVLAPIAPLLLKIAPKGAIPHTLRTTVLNRCCFISGIKRCVFLV